MDNHEITEGIYDFILGGKAEFTIFQNSHDNLGSRQAKYKVQHSKNKDYTNCWFVYTELKENVEPTEDMYTAGRDLVYQGFLSICNKDKGAAPCAEISADKVISFKTGNKGVQDYNKKAINALLWTLESSRKTANGVLKLPTGKEGLVHVYHHGQCSRCGKKLTDAESLRCGLGPTCRKRV